MAVAKYKTKKGVRYLAEAWRDGVKIAVKAGFKTRLEAMQWEKGPRSDIRTHAQRFGLI